MVDLDSEPDPSDFEKQDSLPESDSQPVMARQDGRWRALFWTILVVAVLLVIGLGPFIPSGGPTITAVLFFVPVVLISCLLGAYIGFGNFPYRWIPVFWLAIFLGWYVDFSLHERNLFLFEIFVCGIVGVVAITTVLLRRIAGDLRQVSSEETTFDALQFGIKDLLIWTTAIAIFVALAQAINGTVRSNSGSVSLPFSIFGMASCLAMGMVVNVWALFGHQITPMKWLVVVAISFLSAGTNYLLMPTHADWFFAIIALINQVLVVLLIISMRRQGFRFVRRTGAPPI